MTLVRQWIVDAQSPQGRLDWIDIPQTTLDAQDAAGAKQALEDGNTATLIGKADAAMADLNAFLAITSPTNAQTVAIVKTLCRIVRVLIRLAIRKLDGTD